METGPRGIGASDVDTIQEQNVKMNIQIQDTAEALDQRNRARVCGLQAVFDQPATMFGTAAVATIFASQKRAAPTADVQG
jgi:hypothetical protein